MNLLKNGDYILEENIKLVTDFICGNFNNWSSNRSYYQAQYNYATKLYHVCRWRRKCSLRPIPKKGEAICNEEWFKCLNVLLLLKTQNSIRPDLQPLLTSRYWTTETYDSVYFNEFIFHTLKHDILKRVINNNMSGSSWYFKRFVYLAVKILDGEVEISV